MENQESDFHVSEGRFLIFVRNKIILVMVKTLRGSIFVLSSEMIYIIN